MSKGNNKKVLTAEKEVPATPKRSVLDEPLAGLDEKFDDSVQKLIDIGKEKGYLLYDEVSDLLPPEISASAEDLDDLFSAFGTAAPKATSTSTPAFCSRASTPSTWCPARSIRSTPDLTRKMNVRP